MADATPKGVTWRVSADEIERNYLHAVRWRMNALDHFMMSSGYPGDLRDARAFIDRLRAENDALRSERDVALATARRDGAADMRERVKSVVGHAEALRDSLHGDCYEGQDWEREKVDLLLAGLRRLADGSEL